MKLHFLQGKVDLLNGVEETNQLDTISKKIDDFFNMKNVHFLLGAGTSSGSSMTMSELFKSLDTYFKNKDEKNSQRLLFEKLALLHNNNLEDILGILYSLNTAHQGLGSGNDNNNYENSKALTRTIEKHIFDNINVDFNSDNGKKVLGYYKAFYRKIALRNKDFARINIFTTNNDLLNENALDDLNIHCVDGFSGNTKKYFNPALFNYAYSKRMDTSIDRFEPVENVVYLYKIHGSINWIEEDNEDGNTFFNIRQIQSAQEYDSKSYSIIYPTPLKQDISLGSPYVDLFREFQQKLLLNNSVLIVIGYSFSDNHVNDIIYRALATNSSFNLLIVNKINSRKRIANIDDNRIFRLWSEEEETGETPIFHFSEIADKLIPDLDTFKTQDELINFIKEFRNTSKQ